jgi:selenocysteine lyase/cysteine desulfurase
MSANRREWLAGIGALVAQASALDVHAEDRTALPAQAAFANMGVSYLNSAAVHPFSLGAAAALQDYSRRRTLDRGAPPFGLDKTDDRIRAKFAALIHADPEEICLTQSTTAGEHLVVRALDIPRGGGRIVTDTLHFPDSAYLYEALQRAGMDVVWVKARPGLRIDLSDLAAAITPGTRLVSLSLVSSVNGFEHDLGAVCELAHSRGALVYCDIVQAAGAVPIDVRRTGVDFAACASYKWLMGDFGLGFLYIRKAVLDNLTRPQFGYYQLRNSVTHSFPYDVPGDRPLDYQVRDDAIGKFAMGTTSGAGAAMLDFSLDYIMDLGVERIQAYRRPLLAHLRTELGRKSYKCITPENSSGPIISYAYENATQLSERMKIAGVQVGLIDNRIRFSISIFNTIEDVDRAIHVL